jgi:hypothetical protein
MGRGRRLLVMYGSRMGGIGYTTMFPSSRILVATSRQGVPEYGEMRLRGLI